MTRHGAWGELQEFDELAGAALSVAQGEEHSDTAGIRKRSGNADHVFHFVISRNDEMRRKQNLSDHPDHDRLKVLPFVAINEGERVLRRAGTGHNVWEDRHE